MKNKVETNDSYTKDITYKRPNQIGVLFCLTKRHFLVFLKNWSNVLFTLMVPMVVLIVYIVFLRPMEVSQLDAAIEEGLGFTYNPETASPQASALVHQIRGMADEWMISGVLSVSCITVALNTNTVMVHDKELEINKDFASSPISTATITASYCIYNACVTFITNIIILFICFIYLAAYGAILPGFVDFLAIVGVILLSTISGTLFTFFICSFIRSGSTLASITAIFSAAVGFLCGAYLPASMMPKGVQYLTMFFPGSYSSGLFRNYFMGTPFKELYNSLLLSVQNNEGVITVGEEGVKAFIASVEKDFSLSLDFFGHNVPVSAMALIIAVFIAILLVLDIFLTPSAIMKGFKKTKIIRRDRKSNEESLEIGMAIPTELEDNPDSSRTGINPDVANVPVSKDKFPFDGEDKSVSSAGHIIDKDD